MSAPMSKDEIVSLVIEISVKVVLLVMVLSIAFLILKPFLVLVLWAVIIAVALSPVVSSMKNRFGCKGKILIIGLTFSGILLLAVPTYIVSDSLISSSQEIAHMLKEGSLEIPPPSDKVAEWPFVGKKIHALWSDTALNLGQTLQNYKSELQEYGGKVVAMVGSGIGAVVQFIVSLIIAAVLMINSEGGTRVYYAISRRILGEKGVELAQLSVLTIQSVVQGIIGIAIIQSGLALVGMVVMDVPFFAVWAFLVLFLAIIQLPPLLILGPIAAYVFSYADTTPAIIFAIYAVFVSLSDAFLKPLLLGRGVDIPMLVILLGAIGGMLLSGIIGLFLGAVILALAYKLFEAWLDEAKKTTLS